MTALAPPPQHDVPSDQLEALIREARDRQRRRRIGIAVTLVVLAAVGGVAYGVDRLASSTDRTTGPAPRATPGSALSGHGVLAYVSRGTLLVLDGRTRSTVQVAARREHPSAPAFSPNGRWLSFALDGGRVGVARSDGSSARVLSGTGAAWLPDSRLLVGRTIYRITQRARVVAAGTAPSNLAAWAPDGSRFAFITRRLTFGKAGSFRGTERLELADSLDGHRRLWHEEPISFNRRKGFTGDAIDRVIVLPRRQGVLVSFDPMQSASLAADGMQIYAIRNAGAPLRSLGFAVGRHISVDRGARVAIGAGGDRYAWRTKIVETCAGATGRCVQVRLPGGRLTLEPAWSPDGATLAFVAAAPEKATAFVQPTLRRWYGTRHLWLLRSGSRHPVEVPHTTGAAAPMWSRDGRSLLYVAGDALWLIRRVGARPVRVAGPLFQPGHWPAYYGQIDWGSQFAWLTRR